MVSCSSRPNLGSHFSLKTARQGWGSAYAHTVLINVRIFVAVTIDGKYQLVHEGPL
jgi:hypothetical protein